MTVIKYITLILMFFASTFLGKLIAKKYVYRNKELEEMKNSLNMLQSKIKFTYDPIPEIFEEIGNMIKGNVGQIFLNAKNNMKNDLAYIAWQNAVEETMSHFNSLDKEAIISLSKLLGQTDVEGQVSQIQVTQELLSARIENANLEKQKNEKLYSKLGVTIGLAIVITLV